MIPARYAASRFPGKLMQELGGKTVIRNTYEVAVATNLFDDVFVVTDSDTIYNEIVDNGGKAIMSKKEHECGSDRIAEAVEFMDVDIVINIQGDEPFTDKQSLVELIDVFKDDNDKHIEIVEIKRLSTKTVTFLLKVDDIDVFVVQNGDSVYSFQLGSHKE